MWVRAATASVMCCALLQGCGGGGASEGSQVDTPAPGGNHAPTITGSSPAQITAGQTYSFKPQASDADGDALTFSISNKPAWANFNTGTGELSGTPTAAASTAGIMISVSDGKASASLTAFTLTVVTAGATEGSATVSWSPPTTHTDGSALSDLSGYRIRYGHSAASFDAVINIDNPGLSSYVIEHLPAGTYFFVVTAYDSSGNESDFSDAVSKTIS